MGKSEEKQTKKRAQKATDGESKHKKQTSFATFGSNSRFEIKDTDAELRRHARWQDHFRQLCEYKVQFGNCIVTFKYSANPKLGRWVADQRCRYKKNTREKSTFMTAERTRALNGIGFDWGTRKADFLPIWNERIAQLREFKEQFGHCLVPNKYPSNLKLGLWVATQRTTYKYYQQGKPCSMTAERIRELESVGFKWARNYVFRSEQSVA